MSAQPLTPEQVETERLLRGLRLSRAQFDCIADLDLDDLVLESRARLRFERNDDPYSLYD